MTANRHAPHSALVTAIRLALGKDPRVVVWPNQQGVAKLEKGGRLVPFRYGLAVGSSDLIGMARVVMGDRSIARFLALEVKTGGARPTPDQVKFLALVNGAIGGYGTIVRSVEDAVEAVERACRGNSAP